MVRNRFKSSGGSMKPVRVGKPAYVTEEHQRTDDIWQDRAIRKGNVSPGVRK